LSCSVTIIGVGSIAAGPQTLAALAGYFGERPLEIRLFDGDLERLDLMDRLFRVFCALNKCDHEIVMEPDLAKALSGADRVVWIPDANCLRKAPRLESDFARLVEPRSDVLCLGSERDPAITSFWHAAWPAPLTDEETFQMPLQILRWLRGEEYPYALLKQFEKSPLTAWLDDPSTADYVGA